MSIAYNHLRLILITATPNSFFFATFIGNVSADGQTIYGFAPQCGYGRTTTDGYFTAVADGLTDNIELLFYIMLTTYFRSTLHNRLFPQFHQQLPAVVQLHDWSISVNGAIRDN